MDILIIEKTGEVIEPGRVVKHWSNGREATYLGPAREGDWCMVKCKNIDGSVFKTIPSLMIVEGSDHSWHQLAWHDDLDVGGVRKRLLKELQNAVLKTRKGNALDTVVYNLVRDAYEAAGWDMEHRIPLINQLCGAIEMSKIASATTEPILQVYREVMVETLDILQAETNGVLASSERLVPILVEALAKYKV